MNLGQVSRWDGYSRKGIQAHCAGAEALPKASQERDSIVGSTRPDVMNAASTL